MEAATQVIYAYTPTEAELEQERLNRCRPKDDSTDAVRSALTAIESEQKAASARLQSAREQASRLLPTGNVPEIKRARAAVEDAEIALDVFASMRNAMATKLVEAEAAEVARLRDLKARIPAAEAAIARWRAFLEKDYPKHASAIAAGMELEQPAFAAFEVLREAARLFPDRDGTVALPAAPGGRSYNAAVSLPGFKTPPVPYVSPYAKQ